jgi:hypothetical protein
MTARQRSFSRYPALPRAMSNALHPGGIHDIHAIEMHISQTVPYNDCNLQGEPEKYRGFIDYGFLRIRDDRFAFCTDCRSRRRLSSFLRRASL